MLSNVRILLAMAAYFTAATIAYGIWTYLEFGAIEPIGTAAMGLTMVLSIFIAYYLYSGHRRTAMLPEDNLEGNISDESGEVGFFSPWSWWPLILGASAALAFLALAVGWWLFYISIPFVLVGVIGFVYEYSRGQHAH
jgi:cbb3-type cytochrome oxidase subunit 3